MLEAPGLFAATEKLMAKLGIEEWDLDPDGVKADLCGCVKPENCYGSGGWHIEVKEDGTEVVYARCDPYFQAVADQKSADKAIAAIRRRWTAMNEGEKIVARRDIEALQGRGREAREVLEDLKMDSDG